MKKFGILLAFLYLTCATNAFAESPVYFIWLDTEQDGNWSNDKRDYASDCTGADGVECTDHVFTGVPCGNIDGLSTYAATHDDLDYWNWYYYDESGGGLNNNCDDEFYRSIYISTWATGCQETGGLNNEDVWGLAARLYFKVDSSETYSRRGNAICMVIVI